MRVVLFAHSLLSDWNHGNAHFLRGIVRELGGRGHDVSVYEPRDSWSLSNLLVDRPDALERFAEAYPDLASTRYDLPTLDLDGVLDRADLVLVHEWNEPELVRRVGEARATGGRFGLLFHDTHHRAATAPEEMERYELQSYDGVLAFGEVLRELYLQRGWAERAWTWHEAADTTVFRPLPPVGECRELVWIGNWGDGERTGELREFLTVPADRLELRGTVHGVRYPPAARAELAACGLAYRGWLPNYEAPAAFARHRVTVHVPRRPYVRALPGIPTIRPFEALACGIPLVSAPWEDAEGLFRPGVDHLLARDGAEMTALLREVLADDELAGGLAAAGLETIRSRHTCAHRVDELLAVAAQLRPVPAEAPA